MAQQRKSQVAKPPANAPRIVESAVKWNPTPVNGAQPIYAFDRQPKKESIGDLLEDLQREEVNEARLDKFKRKVREGLISDNDSSPKRYNVINGEMYADHEGLYSFAQAVQIMAIQRGEAAGTPEEKEKMSDILKIITDTQGNAFNQAMQIQSLNQPPPVNNSNGNNELLTALINKSSMDPSVIMQMFMAQQQQNQQQQQDFNRLMIERMSNNQAAAPPKTLEEQVTGLGAAMNVMRSLFAPPPAPDSSNLISIGGGQPPMTIENAGALLDITLKKDRYMESRKNSEAIRNMGPEIVKAIQGIANSGILKPGGEQGMPQQGQQALPTSDNQLPVNNNQQQYQQSQSAAMQSPNYIKCDVCGTEYYKTDDLAIEEAVCPVCTARTIKELKAQGMLPNNNGVNGAQPPIQQQYQQPIQPIAQVPNMLDSELADINYLGNDNGDNGDNVNVVTGQDSGVLI